ncbi:MAG TPA: universal stress protein [Gaiellaceae bacterium]|jgi:nucleotide-binding universal stress UspA family protein
MVGSIICGVDGSKSAKGAARVARALAGELGLGVTFVRVVGRNTSDAKVSAIAERLERLSGEANDLDCGATWLVEVGDPAETLVAAAEAVEAALIVVGSTGPRSSLSESISADVARRASCPVLVVPPKADGRFEVGVERQSAGLELHRRTVRFPDGGRGTQIAVDIVGHGVGAEPRGG